MSTKTIAVETTVYARLAGEKRGSESFTRTISRLMDQNQASTCAAAVSGAAALWHSLGHEAEAERMEAVVREGRADADWSVESPG